jgi:hypothetical protein
MANISGWYYDNQLENRLTSVSLHANMIFTGDENNVKWDFVPETEDREGHKADKEDQAFHGISQVEDDKGREIYYDVVPICRSICNEDFNVNITNDWSDFGIDNIAGSLWNGIRQIEPYKSVIGNALKDIVKGARENSKDWDNKTKHSWTENINKGISWLADNYDKYLGKFEEKDYFNRALIMQGTKFSYYGGSNVNFTNLGMRFTLFPIFKDGKYVSVLDQAKLLYKYLMGSVENFDWGETGKYIDETTKKYLMWQKAPIDFTPNLQDYDVIQQGTLKLKIGSLYAIPNLVCNDANFIFSKQMVKFPANLQAPDHNIELSPLFCDVAISLRPVSKYSERMLRRLVNNDRQTHKDVQTEISDSLQKEIETIKKNYNV